MWWYFQPFAKDGGGVVFEALASGAVPVILDHGGPGDIVHPDVGYKVPPTNETEVVSQMEKILADLAGNRELLHRLRQQGMSYARECLTWDAKAHSSTSILRWVLGQGPKPDLKPSTIHHRPCHERSTEGSAASGTSTSFSGDMDGKFEYPRA